MTDTHDLTTLTVSLLSREANARPAYFAVNRPIEDLHPVLQHSVAEGMKPFAVDYSFKVMTPDEYRATPNLDHKSPLDGDFDMVIKIELEQYVNPTAAICHMAEILANMLQVAPHETFVAGALGWAEPMSVLELHDLRMPNAYLPWTNAYYMEEEQLIR